jgi:predicted O-methyltransferase YrrM
MSLVKTIVKSVVPEPVLRRIRLSRHARTLREFYFGRQLRTLKPILFESGELHNFTYDLTNENLRYMAEMIAVATGKKACEIESYIGEVFVDAGLRDHFNARMASYKGQKSPRAVKSPFGRRLGWYAAARAIKPGIVIETGVERGHGALLLCAALLRNAKEGFPGRYFGTDINPQAGWLLSAPYASVGKLLIGDSIASLRGFCETVDLFINDSDHSADYEGQEYEAIAPMLSPRAIILGDNAHVTDKLALFARKTGRKFIMFAEKPKDHWYPGGGIGIAFPD